jgi:hypothetical protein
MRRPMLKVVDFSLIFASKEVSAHHSVCMTNLNVCLIGQRAFIGKCCMDRDCPDDYIESTEQSIASTQQFLAHFDHLQPDKSPDSTTPKINGKIDTSASPPLVQPQFPIRDLQIVYTDSGYSNAPLGKPCGMYKSARAFPGMYDLCWGL